MPPEHIVGGSFIYSLHDEARQIPSPNPTNAVGGSFIYSLHDEARQILSPNPTNPVGGSFIYSLHDEARQILSPNPTNAVGGAFIYSLQAKLPAAPSLSYFLLATRGREGKENGSPACVLCRLCLNNPRTALVGFSEFSHSLICGWNDLIEQRSERPAHPGAKGRSLDTILISPPFIVALPWPPCRTYDDERRGLR